MVAGVVCGVSVAPSAQLTVLTKLGLVTLNWPMALCHSGPPMPRLLWRYRNLSACSSVLPASGGGGNRRIRASGGRLAT